jgi:hypothetical protein
MFEPPISDVLLSMLMLGDVFLEWQLQDVLTDEKQFTRLKLPADFLSHIHKVCDELPQQQQ